MKKFEKDWVDLFEWITEVLVEREIVPTKKELKKYITNSGYYTVDLQNVLKEKEINEDYFLKEIISDLRDAYKEVTKEKLRKVNSGKKLSKETKKKIGEASKKLGLKPPSKKGMHWKLVNGKRVYYK